MDSSRWHRLRSMIYDNWWSNEISPLSIYNAIESTPRTMDFLIRYCQEPFESSYARGVPSGTPIIEPEMICEPLRPSEIFEDGSPTPILGRVAGRIIAYKITRGWSDRLQVRTVLLRNGMQEKCQSIYQKTLMVRHVLNRNRELKLFNLRVNP